MSTETQPTPEFAVANMDGDGRPSPGDSAYLPEHFVNRELSWLEFNGRVLEEAEDPTNPLLERVKFLSIFSSNLDEFFMVRVAGLHEQTFGDGAPQDYAADGLSPLTQLKLIHHRTQALVAAQYRCWNESVAPQLAAAGVLLLKPDELDADQKSALDRFFSDRAFPILTPMAIDPSHPNPRYHNRALYLAAMLERRRGLGPRHMFAVVQLPQVLPRLVPLGSKQPGQHEFMLLEDAICARLPELFGGFEVLSATTFRITRDSDIELLEQESDDMLKLVEDRIRLRERTEAVRLEVSADANEELVRMLIEAEELHAGDGAIDGYTEIYRIPGPLDLTALTSIFDLPGMGDLRNPPFIPARHITAAERGGDLFSLIAEQDILLHHPFDSFDLVVDFVSRAAHDPKVLAIKQTLYRTSGDSPIVKALMQAAENGKHVTALVELKARFDEAANVSWARQLERSGVHVVFGFLDLKTHCKVSLVVRQEGETLRRYVHLGTGNYNPQTALLYTDLGLFTAQEDMTADCSALFNLLTGYSQGHVWRKLIVAPADLHRRTIELISEQTELAQRGKPSRIFAKMNSLVDHRVIRALYNASQAGVPIDLVTRGICCLRPGMPGISENIRVRSVVDRFLEHSRIFVFGPDDDAQVFLASADWMPRNFYRRVEVMFPVEAAPLKARILQEIVPAYLRDTAKSRIEQPDGSYVRATPAEGEAPFRVQQALQQSRSPLALDADHPVQARVVTDPSNEERAL
ncbi:MAG: polyphosphate kinase 1 [Pirellulales bacterium]|nr:polyphosphate kinase 1 [Pirellulales bacterium]